MSIFNGSENKHYNSYCRRSGELHRNLCRAQHNDILYSISMHTLATAEATVVVPREHIKSSCGTSVTPRGPATFKLGAKVTRRHNASITILKASRSVCPKAPQKQRTIYNACIFRGEGAMRTTPFDVADRLL